MVSVVLFTVGGVLPALGALRRLGLLEQRGGRLHLTDRGFDRYHDLERWVTYHLIEPLWEEMLEEHPAHDRPRRHARHRPSIRGGRSGGSVGTSSSARPAMRV